MKKCSSCGKEVVGPHVQFKCPECGKEDIVRCSSCRIIGAVYSCKSCGFSGP